MNIGRRQARGIAGMALTVLGGVAWLYQLYIPAAVAWAGAMIILMSLNRRRRRG
jgi:hypothetical protein